MVYYGKGHLNTYLKSLIIPNQQAKECFWSFQSAISNKDRTMAKQKLVKGHACTKYFPLLIMVIIIVISLPSSLPSSLNNKSI